MPITTFARGATGRQWQRLAALLPGLLLLAALTLGGCAQPYRLTVIHTNDVHSHLTPFNKYGQLCDAKPKAPCFGGTARVAALVEQARQGGANVFLLDAGDQFQGSLYYGRFQGQAAAALMNASGYDAMGLGNHEFDSGGGTLARFIQAVDFPLLAANVDIAEGNPLHGLMRPAALFTRGGRTIGVTGVLTPETAFLSVPGPGVSFADPSERLPGLIAELTNQGADIIIVLSHQGYADDLELARSVDGIDLIVGGHSHTRLGPDPGATGPYPTVVRSPSGQPVLVVQAGQWAREAGRLEVEFDGKGVPRSWQGAPVLLDDSVAPDAEVAALAGQYQAQLAEYMDEVVGRLPEKLDAPKGDCRSGECPLGNVVADALLAVARPAGALAALVNSGSIRSDLPAGDVTVGAVATALPFGNELYVAKLPGEVLLQVLEHGVSRADGNFDSGTGRFLQLAGLRLVWSPARPTGARVLRAEIFDGHLWLPVQAEAEYPVALTTYLLGGGDGYAMLKPFKDGAYSTARTVADALREALARGITLPVADAGQRIRRAP